MNKLELVAPGKIPPELVRSAAGRFPLIEQALTERDVHIPARWTVENVLAASSAGAATVIRQSDRNWMPDTPDIALVLDESRYGISDRSGQFAYKTADFDVAYPDNIHVRGRISIPGFSADDTFAGIPVVTGVSDRGEIDLPEKHAEVFGESNLVDTHLRQFTPRGLRFISFLQGVISGYNDYYAD